MAALSDRALPWLALLQRPEGTVIGIRYTGMAASLFLLLKEAGVKGYEEVPVLAIEQIRRHLETNPIWTAASWSNYYPLNALLDSGASRDDPSVVKAVDWFLESQDSDGKGSPYGTRNPY